MPLVLATRNQGKVREIAELLKGLPVAVRNLDEFPKAPALEEVGGSFVENASLKALSAAQATGCLALADDSGLEVEALGGRPGVLSARYAGEGADYPTMCRKVLAELAGVPGEGRRARFVCAVACVTLDARHYEVRGEWWGHIALAPRGKGGFGYDPVFVPNGSTATVAEWPAAEKNEASHRARAGRALVARLRREGALADARS